jgi:hypothetical protein
MVLKGEGLVMKWLAEACQRGSAHRFCVNRGRIFAAWQPPFSDRKKPHHFLVRLMLLGF